MCSEIERTSATCPFVRPRATHASTSTSRSGSPPSATTLDAVAQRLGATTGRSYHPTRRKADLYCDVQVAAMVRMTEAIGGTFAVESAPGRGTRVVVIVPRPPHPVL